MSKFCDKCGIKLNDDDFLCPSCGAIWGDRIYRTPISFDAENQDTEAAEPSCAEQDEEPTETARKQPRWLLPLAMLCIVLAFGLFLLGTDRLFLAGEGTSAATTTTPAIDPEYPSTSPVDPDLPYTVYTVKFVDPYGTPIPGVYIENLWTFISSGIAPSEFLFSDQNGMVSLIIFNGFNGDVHINIFSVPQGYDQDMVGEIRYYAEGQTEMLIVLKFSDEPPLEIDPVDPSWGDEATITYTIQFVDPAGNPVSGVKIYNPMVWVSSAYLYSNSDGMITFSLPYTLDEVVIRSVPDGYSDELVLVPQSLEGGTYLVIVLKYALDLPTVNFDV